MFVKQDTIFMSAKEMKAVSEVLRKYMIRIGIKTKEMTFVEEQANW
jgi:hypothetical protein